MSRERGQALVEAVVAMPLCIACALALVDAGVVVRDRIATTQAATRAAEAQIAGGDPVAAATAAVPAALRRDVEVRLHPDSVEVSVTSSARIARLAGRPVVHRSTVEVAR